MDAKIGQLKADEGKEKYTGVKPMEADEKKHVKVMEEHKVKACHAKIKKVERFKAKEVVMKSTEANAKSWTLRKKITAANTVFKKAAQDSAVKDKKERKF